MLNDALVNFVQIGSPLSLIAAAGVSIPSGVLDQLGQGVGTAPQNIIGTRTLFGHDSGIGVKKPLILAAIGILPVTANSATLNMQLQGAVDTGVSGGYQPGTWNTFVETGVIAVANLAAGTLLRLEFEPAFPFGTLPRYLRLNFGIPAATNFSAGQVSYAIVTMDRDDYSVKYAGKNYVVA